jgi:DnaJ-class molecular chaperone
MEQDKRGWKDYYEILQVSPHAELSVISAAYRRLAQSYHPDVIQQRISQLKAKIDHHKHRYNVLDSPEVSDKEYDELVRELKRQQDMLSSARMTEINEAYEVLSKPLKRAEYDRIFRMYKRPQESGSGGPTASWSAPESAEIRENWFQRHLHWTWFFAYLIWFFLNSSYILEIEIIGAIFLLLVSGWVIKRKGRSLWWIFLTPVFSPLWLKNMRVMRS